MVELAEIKDQFADLQTKYRESMPKVDPDVINDLLLRGMDNPSVVPMYMVEIFTKPGVDPKKMRSYIMTKTGMTPAIYDDGTHYVINQKLTLEFLKEISDRDDVLEVTAEYTGGLAGLGASHEHSSHISTPNRAKVTLPPASNTGGKKVASVVQETGIGETTKHTYSKYKIAIFTAIGVVGAIIVAGWVFSGGTFPNSNTDVSRTAIAEPALLHGSVTGPAGLPAVGATVVAADQESGYTENAFISINGQYQMDLPEGTYIVMVAFPDGTNKVVNDYQVSGGSANQLDFAY